MPPAACTNSIHSVLAQFREAATSNRDLGGHAIARQTKLVNRLSVHVCLCP